MIKQLTVFLANEQGRLSSVCRALADAGINVHALVLADTAEYGVARFLCDRPEAAARELERRGYRARTVDVLGVYVADRAGGLVEVLDALGEHKVNIEYLYCISSNTDDALDILKVDDPRSVEAALKDAGFRIADPSDIYDLD